MSRSRAIVASGRPVMTVARLLRVSRQALYRTPGRRPATVRRPPSDPVERTIIETARTHPTDGYRMIAALTAGELGVPVNRKRVLRVMRLHRLIQRHRPLARRRRPGTFAVTRPTSSGTST